ncbi:MAG: hypothetical protein ACFFDS_00505 [Candidatus Thorarchaeota archaeon]
MFDEKRNQRIARIIELPIPMAFFDMLEDLASHYGSQEKAILEAIKSHHKEKFGTLDGFKITIIPPSHSSTSHIYQMNTPVTDGKLSKIAENGKKFEAKTQKDLDKVDKLLDKFDDFTSLKDEINSMKDMIQNISVSGGIPQRVRGKADLSSLEVDVVSDEEVLLAPPERPLLESVLDSILLFDDEELDEIVENEVDKKNQKKGSSIK